VRKKNSFKAFFGIFRHDNGQNHAISQQKGLERSGVVVGAILGNEGLGLLVASGLIACVQKK
jgi:hypothetical protein